MRMFRDELARSAEKNARIVCLFVILALALGLGADYSNLPEHWRTPGLVLRGSSLLFWAGILLLLIALPSVFRAVYEEILAGGVIAIGVTAAMIGAWSGEKGLTYFVAILQVEFALATFFTIKHWKFISTVILINMFYVLAQLGFGPGPGAEFANVTVSLVIFGAVSILTHHIISTYKRENFEQRQGLQQSAEQIKNILGSITDAFLALDREWRLTFLNPEAERFFSRDGKESRDLIGKTIWDIYPALVEDSVFFEECHRAMAEQRPTNFEEYYPRLDGYFEVHVYPSPTGLSIAAHEITRRKEAEEGLKTSLEEKEVLLRHIHHGVKNNLQVISSLLNLQSHITPAGGEGSQFLRESQNRIKAMALVHEKLYESRDLASINIREFVAGLAGNLFDSYGVNRDRIELELDIGELRMDVDSAVACGMIINELVSNSLKYAFPARATGRVRIFMAEDATEENWISFEVSDDGAGFAGEPDFNSGSTLGLRLVKILIERQLNGTFEIKGQDGTALSIRFPRKAAGPRISGPKQELAGTLSR